MALRFANKINSIVNNVVLRNNALQCTTPCALQRNLKLQSYLEYNTTFPKTRYPLNQQDANSYIENLKKIAQNDTKDADIVRTFKVDIAVKGNNAIAGPSGIMKWDTCGQRAYAHKAGKGSGGKPKGKGKGKQKHKGKGKGKDKQGKRVCAGKAGKVKKLCKPGPAADEKKCKKLKKDGCKQFKIDNCKVAKQFVCNKRPYVFKNCKKVPAPYPAFSEACYEEPYPVVLECRDCPYTETKHPTFKPPMNKYLTQTKKFHTSAKQNITLRFGPQESIKKSEESIEKPRAVRPGTVIQTEMSKLKATCRRCAFPTENVYIPKFNYKPLPPEQTTEPVTYFVDRVEEARQRIREIESQEHMQQTIDTLNKIILAKKRIKVTRPPLCGGEREVHPMKKKTCTKKIKSQVCPVDLLDRKPYKKYREGVKKRQKADAKRKSKKSGKKQKKKKKGGKKAKGLSGDLAQQLMDENISPSALENPSRTQRQPPQI